MKFQRFIAFLSLLSLLAGPVAARTRKGDKLLQQGRRAEASKQWDQALEFYEAALRTDPADPAYLAGVQRVRFQSAQAHVDAGQRLRDEGKLGEALSEFQKAYAIDPSSSIAEQELRRTFQMIQREKEKPSTSAEDRGLTPAQVARKESEARVATAQAAPELRPITRQFSNLKMNNQPVKVLFDTVGKLAGLNVVFDPEYPRDGKNFTIDLSNTTLEEALDNIAILTKSFWKPMSANTIFVTQDNATKRRDYEDLVVKVFYLTNITSPQELQEVATAIRTLTDIRRVFTYNAQNAILVRGTVDQVLLTEKLVNDMDKQKSEVVIDVLVMTTNRGRTRQIAATLTSGGVAGLNLPIQFTPRNAALNGGTSTTNPRDTTRTTDTGVLTGTTTTTGTTSTTGTTAASGLIALSQIGRVALNDFSTTLPGALVALVSADRQTRVLQSPQIRALDGVKSTLKIGDRIPYATGSFQPGVGSVGVSPLVSTQFNFVDTGVNVDITPKIHAPNEVSMQIDIDISSVRDRIDLGGLSQPVIGQSKASQQIRVRDGEVSLLAGLNQDQDSKNLSGIPGLLNVPILRSVLGNDSREKNQSELLIAIIPHIIRTPDLTANNLRAVAAGNDQLVKLSIAPPKEPEPKPAVPATPAAPATVPGAPAPNPAAPAAANPAAPAPNQARVSFAPASVTASVGGGFTVSLQADNVVDLFQVPLRVKYDNKILRLVDVRQGSLLSADGQQINLTRDIRNDSGEAVIGVNRLAGAQGISGTGPVITLQFQAVAKGATTITLPELTLRNSQLQPLPMAAGSAQPVLAVTVQ